MNGTELQKKATELRAQVLAIKLSLGLFERHTPTIRAALQQQARDALGGRWDIMDSDAASKKKYDDAAAALRFLNKHFPSPVDASRRPGPAAVGRKVRGGRAGESKARGRGKDGPG